MLRPRRFAHEIDPGPVQIQARKVHFDVSDAPLHWIPGHPVASNVVSLLNVVLPAGRALVRRHLQRGVATGEGPQLADDMRGFIGQEATHADVHDQVLHEFMVATAWIPAPILDQVEYVFSKVLAPAGLQRPEAPAQPPVRPAVADRGDRALHRGDGRFRAELRVGRPRCRPDPGRPVPLARQRGGRAPQRRPRRRRLLPRQLPRPDPRDDRWRSMHLRVLPARRLVPGRRPTRPADIGWWRCNGCAMRDSRLGLLPSYRKLFGSTTLAYFRPGYSPEEVGSTAQAVAYLASSPAARAAHM